MDTSSHHLPGLFGQLGLADDAASIEAFIRAHRPLPAGVRLADAPFWTASQARFLREAIASDADWASVVDSLAARLMAPAATDQPPPATLLVLSGSAREASLNRRLAACAAAQARQAGLAVLEVDAALLRLPVYDGDLEASQGVPEGAHRLLDALLACDGLLLSTPEYNGFPPPLLINAFDWVSRIPAREARPAGLAATAGRPVGLLSASPGPGGGLRAMNFLRQYLQMALQMVVVPQQLAVGKAHEAFDDSGALRDARQAQALAGVLRQLGATALALRPVRAAG